jgi:hypothetical protein
MPSIKNPLPHAYWLVFEPSPDGGLTFMSVYRAGAAHHVPRAVGVTAFTVDDALSILDEELFAEGPRPALQRVVEDVEVDQLHELAREAGLPSWFPEGDAQRATTLFRGIWFPFPGYRLAR